MVDIDFIEIERADSAPTQQATREKRNYNCDL